MHAYFETRRERFVKGVTYGMTFPLHLHTELELYLILEGQSEVRVGNEVRILNPGDMAVIFPNRIHSYAAMTADVRAAMIICDLSYAGGYAETLLSHIPADSFVPAGLLHKDVPYAVKAVLGETQEHSAVFAPLIQLVLARLLPGMVLRRSAAGADRELTYGVVHYIGEHFREQLTLENVSAALGVSKYHLSHLFSEKINESFPTYLTNIRLSYAGNLLEQTDLSVTEVAIEAGFESLRTFFRAFHSRYDTTPLQYRRSRKGAGRREHSGGSA